MYTMKEACKKTGLQYETLKFYCNQGLVPNVKRDDNNFRLFSDRDIAWVNSLRCLKNCGMSIKEMKEYIELAKQGEKSIPERKVILKNRREKLLEEIQRLQGAVAYLDKKLAHYDDMLSGKVLYFSNLIQEESAPEVQKHANR